jgi:hypothetical protein
LQASCWGIRYEGGGATEREPRFAGAVTLETPLVKEESRRRDSDKEAFARERGKDGKWR